MIEGSCHCGEVHWRYDGRPDSATMCNCTWCRRHGVLWAYADEGRGIDVRGATRQYLRGERVIEFHFCAVCGCLAYWRAVHANPHGRRRMAVNLRLAEPGAVAEIPSNILTASTPTGACRATTNASPITGFDVCAAA